MRNVAVIITLVILGFSCQKPKEGQEFNTITNEKTNQLDSLYTEHYHKGEFNGNVLVAEKGNIIFQKSYGLANEETKNELNIKTAFELASVSKQFTAMGIVQLQKEGKLSYDDLISKYIPELEDYEGITIRNLLTHTGGLPDYMRIAEENWDKTKIATNDSVIKLFQELQPEKEFEAGEKFSYSNTGYLLLGTIIERVSGNSFEAYLKEKIFTPLDMKNTFVYQRRYQPEEVDNYALGYIYSDSLNRKILPDESGDDSYYVYLDGIVGDGMVSSNLHDLLKWDRALYENALINEDDKKLIFSSYPTLNDEETNYGFGWRVKQDSLYGKIVNHSGRWAGYLTHIERHPDNDKTIIILQNNEIKITEIPIQNTRRILYGQPIEKFISLPEDILAKYAGTYYYEDGRKTNITYEFVRLWDNGMLQLKPVSETKFVLDLIRPEVTYEFFVDENDEAYKLNIQQTERGIDWTVTR